MNISSFVSTSGEMNPLLFVWVVVDLILRGIALYKSARKDKKVWFVALLVINSMGILPIIYLLVNKEIQINQPTKKVGKNKK